MRILWLVLSSTLATHSALPLPGEKSPDAISHDLFLSSFLLGTRLLPAEPLVPAEPHHLPHLSEWLLTRPRTTALLFHIAGIIDKEIAAPISKTITESLHTSIAMSDDAVPLLQGDEAALREIFALDGSGAHWKDARALETWGDPGLKPCRWLGVTCLVNPGEPFARVVKLAMTGFNVRVLSPKIGDLTALAYLHLGDNDLRAVPESLSNLDSLLTLWLNFNPNLAELPDAVFAGMASLHELYLFGCSHLRAVPSSVANLTSLVYLFLQSNSLSAMPRIEALTKLSVIALNDNPIPEAAAFDFSALPRLERLYISKTGISRVPRLPASLSRLDINGNLISGAAPLCGPNITMLNMNDNALLAEVVGAEPCLPLLRSINADGCNLTSTAFVDSVHVTDIDVSNNPWLGKEPFERLGAGRWPVLQSLRAENVGASSSIAAILAVVFKVRSMISLDLAGNPGVGGGISAASFMDAGIYDGRVVVPFGLVLLRLDGTSVAYFQSTMESFFTSVRVLSLRNATRFSPEVSFTIQTWLHLETVDLRGVNASLNSLANPTPFDNAVTVDVGTNSSCPSSLLGGTVAEYAITADPKLYNYSRCRCLEGYYGQPANGCIECPAVPAGETGITAECQTRPGMLSVDGGWFVFRQGRVEVVACPGDSQRSPCGRNRLGVTVRTLGDWDRLVIGPGLNITRCNDGYEGRLCSRCQPGFFRSGRSCYRCGARGLSWLNPLLSVLVITLLGVKSVAGGFSSRSGLIRTVTMHAQLVALLPDMSLRLTDWAGFLIKSSGSGGGGLHLNGLECEGRGWDGFYGPFVQAALLPVVVAFAGVWIGLLSGLFEGGKGLPARERIGTAGLYLWLVLLFGSMQRLLAPLNCTDHGSTHGSRYLTAALWIRCSGSSYRGLLATSVVLGLGYTAATIGLVLYRLRPSTKGTSTISVYLRSPYRQETYYWEAVQLIRRVALAMASSLTKLNSPLQPVIVSSVLILSLLAHTLRKPYVRALDNIVESVSLTLLLSSYMAGLIASNPRFPSSATTSISWLFFTCNALFLASLTLTVLLRSAKTGLERARGRRRDQGGEDSKGVALLIE